MSGLLILGLIITALVVVGVAAIRWGVDTRPGFPDDRKPSGLLSTR